MATLTLAPRLTAETLETVLVRGDLSTLSAAQRVDYLLALCESTGLNPLTSPFEYLELDGRTVLYAKKSATDQLRAIHGISSFAFEREEKGDVYSVIAHLRTRDGRKDQGIGIVPLVKEEVEWRTNEQTKKRYPVATGKVLRLTAMERANAMMKAHTKAQRRGTLSLCGLGSIIDETELDTMPQARRVDERNDTAEKSIERAGKSADGIIRELVRYRVQLGDDVYMPILQLHGWSKEEDCKARKVREAHELIRELNAALRGQEDLPPVA